METEKIIAEVKKRPVIWDSTEECYKNKTMKNDAWLEVAASLEKNFKNMSEVEQKSVLHEINMKWRSIRDNYVRYKKKMSEMNSRGVGVFEGKPVRSYIYAKQLRFLSKCLPKEPPPAAAAEETTPTTSVSTDYIDPMELVQTQVFEPVPDYPSAETEDNDTTTCSYTLPTKKSRCNSYTLSSPGPSTSFQMAMTTTNSQDFHFPSNTNAAGHKPPTSLEEKLSKFMEDFKPRNFDEDFSFFESLMPTIKDLSNDEKLEFRIKTLQLLQDIKKKRENVTAESPLLVKIKEEI
ncbi:uncharacterized protein [Musca autumnalis]|uniref:uncharacterized protein n=1 Tax=Musca autumnalis TaxID=221902 RepID=UPI003CF58596